MKVADMGNGTIRIEYALKVLTIKKSDLAECVDRLAALLPEERDEYDYYEMTADTGGD